MKSQLCFAWRQENIFLKNYVETSKQIEQKHTKNISIKNATKNFKKNISFLLQTTFDDNLCGIQMFNVVVTPSTYFYQKLFYFFLFSERYLSGAYASTNEMMLQHQHHLQQQQAMAASAAALGQASSSIIIRYHFRLHEKCILSL